MKHTYSDWSNEFGFESYEKGEIKKTYNEIPKDSYEALTRFYQKESRRSKTSKQKKHCWQ